MFIEDAADGSGDGILTFPPEMVETLGWKAGDTLNLIASGTGTITVTKV
jgi:bifunctional DNA-binding transcriptional regulator/antitoxin component of YhaV-PrlF toxin-antitoxin module